MIDRYASREMTAIWSDEARFEHWKEVEVTVCEVRADRGEIPAEAAKEIRAKGAFETERVLEIGCGAGLSARYLLRKTGCRLTGIDLAKDLVKPGSTTQHTILSRNDHGGCRLPLIQQGRREVTISDILCQRHPDLAGDQLPGREPVLLSHRHPATRLRRSASHLAV